MTRIVAGSAKGRRLLVPAAGTRPTSERAREALFSSLTTLLDFEGARVLDLFAGTGAVGLEALSRGAAHATFVESAPATLALLQRNIDSVGLAGAVVVRGPVEVFLRSARSGGPYQIVFADPPYAVDHAALSVVLDLLAEGETWLAPGALVILERSARGSPPEWPHVIEPIKERRYGDSVLWYGRRR